MGQFQVILVMPSYGLIPAPPHLRHLTILSPFLKVPLPSQFLHFCFFCPVFFLMESSKVDRSNLGAELVLRPLIQTAYLPQPIATPRLRPPQPPPLNNPKNRSAILGLITGLYP